jgi:hypothetical protein
MDSLDVLAKYVQGPWDSLRSSHGLHGVVIRLLPARADLRSPRRVYTASYGIRPAPGKGRQGVFPGPRHKARLKRDATQKHGWPGRRAGPGLGFPHRQLRLEAETDPAAALRLAVAPGFPGRSGWPYRQGLPGPAIAADGTGGQGARPAVTGSCPAPGRGVTRESLRPYRVRPPQPAEPFPPGGGGLHRDG